VGYNRNRARLRRNRRGLPEVPGPRTSKCFGQ
jgi:hypothetical protein